MTVKTTKAFKYIDWPVQNVLAFSTTRLHPENIPISTVPFDSFNLGLHVGELAETTENNRRSLTQFLPLHSKIQWLNQVHGDDVAVVDNVSTEAITADAAITRHKNVSLAVMTADCLPILLTSENGDEVAAIHGGWRPLSKGIIENVLGKMKTSNQHINVWLGPCIGAKAFEVGLEVKDIFVDQNKAFESAFSMKNNDKYLADLHQIARIQLQLLGINKIFALSDCTYTEHQQYYSYRRENTTGRMASIIARL